MKTNYILTRLENTPEGDINYSWKKEKEEKEKVFWHMPKFITWNWKWLKDEASKLKVGESKIYEEDI